MGAYTKGRGVLLAAFACVLLAAAPSLAQTNLALTAAASASSELAGAPATNANDANDSTWWTPETGQEPDSWIQLTWGTPQTFTKLVIRESAYTYLTAFDVQILVDGDWENVTYGSYVIEPDTTVFFSPVTTTAVRVVMREASDWIINVAELEVYLAEVNYARGATPTSSGAYSATYPETKMIDGKWAVTADCWLAKTYSPSRHPR